MKELERDPLAQRLASLDIPMPPELVPRVLSGRPVRRARPWIARRLLAAGAVALPLAGLLYWCPVLSQAVADSPLLGTAAGPVLRTFGLAEDSQHLTSFGASASSSGYTIYLEGGYADATRTVLLLRTDPPDGANHGLDSLKLTDQFGRKYRSRGANANVETGYQAAEFVPFGWPASLVGVRFTLQVSGISSYTGPTMPWRAVPGSWKLRGTLGVEQGRVLTRPPSGRVGEMTIDFDEVRVTDATLQVRMRITGTSAADLSRMVPNGLKGRPALQVLLVDANGAVLLGGTSSSTGTREGAVVTSNWYRTGPGRYRMVVSYEGAGTLEREIVIPSVR